MDKSAIKKNDGKVDWANREKRDSKVKGLIIRKQPSGRTLYYAGYRRPALDKKKGIYRSITTRTSLGRSDHMTLEEARKAASLALSAARLAVSKGLKGDRVRDQVTRALLNLDKSVEEIEAAAAKHDACPSVREYIDKEYGPALAVNQKYARTGREIARLKYILALFQDEPSVDILTMKLNAVSKQTIKNWLTKRRGTPSAKTRKPASDMTIRRDLSAISGVFTSAIDSELISVNPVSGVKFKAIRNDIQRFLGSKPNDPNEERRLLKALEDRENRKREKRQTSNKWAKERGYKVRPEYPADGYVDHLRPLVLLAMNTGLRRGELLALKWGWISLANSKAGNSEISIPGEFTKSGEPHKMPLNNIAASVLRKWRKQNTKRVFDKDSLVFPGKNGEPLYDIRRAWRTVLRDAKITDFRFHDLRHHFASMLVNKGAPLSVVRELLNHADYQMLKRYTHASDKMKRAGVDKLAEGDQWTI